MYLQMFPIVLLRDKEIRLCLYFITNSRYKLSILDFCVFKFLIQIFLIVTCSLTVSFCIIVTSTLSANDFYASSLSSETKAQRFTRLSVTGCYQNKYLCMRSLRQDFVFRFLQSARIDLTKERKVFKMP